VLMMSLLFFFSPVSNDAQNSEFHTTWFYPSTMKYKDSLFA
jgi:hypothetical protein